VFYLDFLGQVHQRLDPAAYLEIGVRHGDSLALAQAPSVGIDPEFDLRVEVPPQAQLFEETSDDYFARPDPLAPLGGRPPQLAFIDGMHLVEFALRDFMNVERHAHWTTVVVFDDILPRDGMEAARERKTREWTGDVFKILAVLERYRPDLICLRIGTQPTGLLLVMGLDPGSRVLRRRYARIEREAIAPDPQDVPMDVLEHRGVLDPGAVLGASFWDVLREARASDVPRRTGIKQLRDAVAELGVAPVPPLRRLLALR
jgi:hypothetical protein